MIQLPGSGLFESVYPLLARLQEGVHDLLTLVYEGVLLERVGSESGFVTSGERYE
jgi:hypothetical protein